MQGLSPFVIVEGPLFVIARLSPLFVIARLVPFLSLRGPRSGPWQSLFLDPQAPEIAASGQNAPFLAMTNHIPVIARATEWPVAIYGPSRFFHCESPRHPSVIARPFLILSLRASVRRRGNLSFTFPNTPWIPEIATSLRSSQ